MMPATAYSQVAELNNISTPTQTQSQTPVSTQCLDFNQDGICESIVLVNGTIIKNPGLPVTGPIINNNISTSTPTVNTTAVNTTSEQVSEYYCTSNGCGYYRSGICLDCDTDKNGAPDEMYDPRDRTFEGCDDPTLVCGDAAFSIPPGEILRPTFSLNVTGFSIADDYPNTAVDENDPCGEGVEYKLDGEIFCTPEEYEDARLVQYEQEQEDFDYEEWCDEQNGETYTEGELVGCRTTETETVSSNSNNDNDNDDKGDEENDNDDEDIVYCEGQSVPEGADSCYDQYDFEEGDGSGCDDNDDYCNEEDECGRSDVDCIDDTKFDEDDYDG
jgi:hypothetical protein